MTPSALQGMVFTISVILLVFLLCILYWVRKCTTHANNRVPDQSTAPEEPPEDELPQDVRRPSTPPLENPTPPPTPEDPTTPVPADPQTDTIAALVYRF